MDPGGTLEHRTTREHAGHQLPTIPDERRDERTPIGLQARSQERPLPRNRGQSHAARVRKDDGVTFPNELEIAPPEEE